jgi:hypothetical protein
MRRRAFLKNVLVALPPMVLLSLATHWSILEIGAFGLLAGVASGALGDFARSRRHQ